MSEKWHLDDAGMVKALFDHLGAGLYTALPGVIVSFDSAKCLASVQPAVRMKTVIPNAAGDANVVKFIDLPVVEHVPICLPHSATGGLFLTVPVKPGDQCLLVFAHRGIDRVVDDGGIQNPPDGAAPAYSQLRHHDMTDAICIPSLMVVPNAIAGWAQDAVELRSADGATKVSVKAAEVTVQVGAVTMVISAAGVQITSAAGVQITGPVVVTGEVTANGIPLSTHIHGGVETGEGDTGVPKT